MVYDLIVVGAGPAGSAAAITAVRKGASVLLLEKGSFPRQRVCGEFVSSESLSLLAGLLDDGQQSPLTNAVQIDRARIFLDGHELHTPINPAAASITRFDLDSALWMSARSFGVVAMEHALVRDIGMTDNGNPRFLVSAPDVVFEGRCVIQCCGRWSNLNSNASVAAGAEKWLGMKVHVDEPQPSRSVDLYFFDGGYCGVQPVGPVGRDGWARVNTCAMVKADVARTLEQIFELSPALASRSRSWRMVGPPVSTSPLVFRPPDPVRECILQAGDAAAFVDPFVGDGISLALRSGAMAAKSVLSFLKGELSLSQAADRYRDLYLRRLGPVFRNASRIRGILAFPKGVRYPVLRFMEAVPALGQWMVQKTR